MLGRYDKGYHRAKCDIENYKRKKQKEANSDKTVE